MRATDWLQLLLTVLLGAACLLPLTANFPRSQRDRQVLLPAFALLYGLAAVLLADKLALLIVFAAELLARVFPPLLDFPLALCLSYLTAMLMLLFYPLCKLIFRRPLGWLARRFQPFYEATAGRFYEESEEYGIPVLKPSFRQLRSFARFLFGGTTAAAVLIFACSVRFDRLAAFRYPIYPVIAVLILAEIANFLGGLTLSEYEDEILGMGEHARIAGSFQQLRRLYRQLFPDRFLCDDLTERQYAPESPSRYLEELEQSPDPEQRALGHYFRNLFESGVPLEEGRMRSAGLLLQGRSVLYADPFYRDLTPYLTFAFCRTLVRGGKVLLVTGRPDAAGKMVAWLRESLDAVTNVPGLWRVGTLGEPELDAAVLPSTELYNQTLLEGQRGLLKAVSFVFLTEPSRLAATGQIGLRMLLDRCSPQAVCAACDRNQDGLLDALSHLLGVSMTEVVSTEAPAGMTAAMFWGADGPSGQRILSGVARDLGFGAELAAVAMKNQITGLRWIGADRVPLLDLGWLTGQYHQPICAYAGLPASQQAVESALAFVPALWGEERREQFFAIVEDEFDNLFEVSRQFLTRATGRAFVHVLSGRYLLRDYMCANREILAADPKAFPSITADYAPTPRNTAIHLLILLSEGPVPEEEVARLLSRTGDPGGESGSAATIDRLTALIARYFPLEQYPGAICSEERRELSEDGARMVRRRFFSIDSPAFSEEVVSLLRSAYYLSEKRDGTVEALGSRLLCHVYQAFLPGQHFTFSGKYYEIRSISREKGVLVQRAADHFAGRKSYRQLRRCRIERFEADPGMGGVRRISGIELVSGSADITVETDGYLSLPRYDDLKNGRKVLVGGIPPRCYRRKALLRLTFPGIGEKARVTVAVLLSELFRTAFPDSSDYLSVASSAPADLPDGLLCRLEDPKDASIYILEDSQVDLGLCVAVERSLLRLLEQMTDYLLWHRQMMGGRSRPAPEPDLHPAPIQDADAPDTSASDAAAPNAEENPADLPAVQEASPSAALSISGQEESPLHPQLPGYAQNHYLLYGFSEIPAGLDPDAALDYLISLGFDQNPLRAAREWTPPEESAFAGSGHCCDFCGIPLSEAEYDVLSDGRERCTACRRTAIDTLPGFQSLYLETRSRMEEWFGLHIGAGIRVRMVNAAALARKSGRRFVPTAEMTRRAVGMAVKDRDGYTLFVENGAPRIDAAGTIVHELTHIWQYRNWDTAVLRSIWAGMPRAEAERCELEVYEGMAVWAEIQYLRLLRETARADRLEAATLARDDEYGRGLKRYLAEYPFGEAGMLPPKTPFQAGSRPLPPQTNDQEVPDAL